MTFALAGRRAVFPSLALTAMLVALTPNGSRAESLIVAPFDPLPYAFDPLSHANESAGRDDPVARVVGPVTTGSGQTVRNDDATGETTLVENAWDFTKPDSIPGFASTPYPALSNPEIAD